MSTPTPAQPAKLVVGLIVHHRSLQGDVARELIHVFGDIDMISPWFDFDFTEYYHAEMGAPLCRRVLVFRELVGQDDLAGIKHRTNGMEERLTRDGRRQVNIDPGILLYERFVLATGKNYSHRIYIGQQIYADLTLIFQKGGYQVLPWTYPDYATDTMRSFLLRVRQKYALDMETLKQRRSAAEKEGA